VVSSTTIRYWALKIAGRSSLDFTARAGSNRIAACRRSLVVAHAVHTLSVAVGSGRERSCSRPDGRGWGRESSRLTTRTGENICRQRRRRDIVAADGSTLQHTLDRGINWHAERLSVRFSTSGETLRSKVYQWRAAEPGGDDFRYTAGSGETNEGAQARARSWPRISGRAAGKNFFFSLPGLSCIGARNSEIAFSIYSAPASTCDESHAAECPAMLAFAIAGARNKLGWLEKSR